MGWGVMFQYFRKDVNLLAMEINDCKVAGIKCFCVKDEFECFVSFEGIQFEVINQGLNIFNDIVCYF